MGFDIIQFHHYNDTILPIAGILVNLLVIYLIHIRTAKELKTYCQTLLQNCTIDLLFNIVILISKSQCDVYDGLLIFMLGGFASKVPHPWDFLFHMSYIYFCIFTITAMVVPFYCRYRVFCKSDTLSKYRVGVLYFYASLVAFSHIFVFGISFLPVPETYDRTYQAIRNSIFVHGNEEVPYFISCDINKLSGMVYIGYTFIILVIAYILIAWFARQIYKKLLETAYPNTKVKRYHFEINRVLIAQAICPLVASVIPMSWALLFVVFRVKVHGVIMLASMSISWICVLNPLNAIVWVSVYRKAVLNPRKYIFSNRVDPNNWDTSVSNSRGNKYQNNE